MYFVWRVPSRMFRSALSLVSKYLLRVMIEPFVILRCG